MKKYIIKPVTIITVGFLFLVIKSLMVSAQSVPDLRNLNICSNTPQLSKTQDLNFGQITPYYQGGSITLTTENTIYKTGNIIIQGFTSPAGFDLYMDAGKTVLLSYPKSVVLNNVNGGGTMTLLLTDNKGQGTGSFVTEASPTHILLGGTLTIGSPLSTKTGNYVGVIQLSYTIIH